uniref:Uncharacterized protein n=1 Tax=Lygus hesperus TaxID=30085 RepID=A0A146L1Y2_LYGHE
MIQRLVAGSPAAELRCVAPGVVSHSLQNSPDHRALLESTKKPGPDGSVVPTGYPRHSPSSGPTITPSVLRAARRRLRSPTLALRLRRLFLLLHGDLDVYFTSVRRYYQNCCSDGGGVAVVDYRSCRHFPWELRRAVQTRSLQCASHVLLPPPTSLPAHYFAHPISPTRLRQLFQVRVQPDTVRTVTDMPSTVTINSVPVSAPLYTFNRRYWRYSGETRTHGRKKNVHRSLL